MTFVIIVAIPLAFVVARFPGEWLDGRLSGKPWIPPNTVTTTLGVRHYDNEGKSGWTSFHDLLFGGKIDLITRERKSLFSNILVLPGFDVLEAAKIEDPKKLESVKHTVNLRGRRLEGAVFAAADLRKADMEGAFLQGASLFLARLQGASLDSACLDRASLNGASLQGSSLNGAWLRDASVNWAELQGASLEDVHLERTDLVDSKLQGATLKGASLEDTSFLGAALQGVNFDGAKFIHTDISQTKTWRTNLNFKVWEAVTKIGVNRNALSLEEFSDLLDLIESEIPDNTIRKHVLNRIKILNPLNFGPELPLCMTRDRMCDDIFTSEELSCISNGPPLFIFYNIIPDYSNMDDRKPPVARCPPGLTSNNKDEKLKTFHTRNKPPSSMNEEEESFKKHKEEQYLRQSLSR